MKRPQLSPFTRQLIIVLLLVALLWQGEPLIEADGRIRVEFADFIGSQQGTSFKAGGYVNICETIRDQKTARSKTICIIAAVPLTSATWKESNNVYLFLDKHLSIGRIVPKRLRLDGGWILVLRMTPEQYETLQAVRQRDGILSCIVGQWGDERVLLRKGKSE